MRISKNKFWTLALVTVLAATGAVSLLVWANRGSIVWPTVDVWEKATDTVEHVTTSLAFIVAGVWAYLQFIRRREDKPRLEPTVTSRSIATGDKNYLLVTVQLRNTGICDVDISRRGTGLEVTQLKPVPTDRWKPPPVQDVFTNHEWIEPGEVISDQVLFETPPQEPLILKLQLLLYSKKHHVRWESTTIVPTVESADGAKSQRWRPT